MSRPKGSKNKKGTKASRGELLQKKKKVSLFDNGLRQISVDKEKLETLVQEAAELTEKENEAEEIRRAEFALKLGAKKKEKKIEVNERVEQGKPCKWLFADEWYDALCYGESNHIKGNLIVKCKDVPGIHFPTKSSVKYE